MCLHCILLYHSCPSSHSSSSAIRTWANALISAAIYPVLAAFYLTQAVGTSIPIWVYSEGIVLLIALQRVADFSALERISIAISAVSLIPSLFFIGFAVSYINPSTWVDTRGEYNCSKASENGTWMPNDDDWAIAQGLCEVKINWGSLMAYALWMVCGILMIRSYASFCPDHLCL